MWNIMGMSVTSFWTRFQTEPILVLKTCLFYWWLKLWALLWREPRIGPYKPTEKINLRQNNVIIPESEVLLDNPHANLDEENGDTVFIYGGNSCNERLVAKITRKKEHNEGWLYLQLSNGRKFELPNQEEKLYPVSPEFLAQGLRIKIRTAFRSFRVSFNGLLREIKEGEEIGALVHVKFSFICVSSCFPFDMKTDIHPAILADYFARESSTFLKCNVQRTTDWLDSVIQTANFYGTVSVDGSQEIRVTLWGLKKRFKEIFPKHAQSKIYEFIGYTKEGQLIYTGECMLPSAKSKLTFGFHLERNTLSWPVTDCKLKIKNHGSSFKGMEIRLYNGRAPVQASVDTPVYSTSWKGVDSLSQVHFTQFKLEDGDEGHGLFIDNTWGCGTQDQLQRPLWMIETLGRTLPKTIPLVMTLGTSSCQDPSLSGGKGSSLATLTHLSQKYPTGFEVPYGFVVTTSAYRTFYSQTGVEAQVAEFQKKAWSYTAEKIKDNCNLLVAKVSKVCLPENIRRAVQNELQTKFPADASRRRFAVRSSASGEDSEEMSAAGQMSSFLGVEGFENIFNAIVKCWASQFSFTAIQYKRQNGQEMNTPMAVVVQEMVSADVAGVLFTCDPVTGNPANVTITANYGLGESVVSASADPDTMVFHRKERYCVEFQSSILGKKTVKIVMGDKGNVVEEETSANDSDVCCLTQERGSKLATIGLKIEEAYGFPVDIEWAYKNNQLYMLQARPITTIDQETKYEVSHASSTTLRAENEYITKANFGEVLPGAVSHLGFSVYLLYANYSIEVLYGKRNKYAFPFNPFYHCYGCFNNGVFLSLTNFMMRFYKKGEQSFLAQCSLVSAFGRILEDEAMYEQADRRNKCYPSTSSRLQIIYFLMDMLLGKRRLNRSLEKVWRKEIGFQGCQNSMEMYERIWHSIYKLNYDDAATAHVICSMNSSIFNSIVLSLLASQNKGWDTKVFSDFALILSSCGNLESADIPRSTKMLAAEIRKCVGAQKFKEMSSEEALSWLEYTTTSAGSAYKTFIERHGHRCIKEIDIKASPWRESRLSLVRTLQDLVGQKDEPDKISLSVDDVMKKLQVHLSWKSRIILRLLIPVCRMYVYNREMSKSLMIKAFDHMRKGFWTLAEQLVIEGRLPDKELMFYLNNYELYDLLKNRSPDCVQRAIRRRHIFPELDELKFPEICSGLPKSLQELRAEQEIEKEEEIYSDLEIKGTPVSLGTVKAFARVATSIGEAADIQKGEILIAYSTDIAWSPYFPLVSGVATELGGLISHGAVVAREYGLPCVVGVRDATRKFKTGDYILLDGTKGILKRLESPKHIQNQPV